MSEQLILDPSEVASNRTELDVTPWLGPDGIDWGDSTVEAFYSESQRGDVPVDFRIPNRQISGGLVLKSVGGTTATAARAAIQSKLALFQREGGWLKRVTNGGGTVYADVVNASFRATSVPGYESRGDFDTGASFSLECIPDFYGDEVTDADNSTTTQRELLYTTALDSSDGDSPNRVRMVVDNDGSTDWRGLIGCFRSRHYPGSTEATKDTGSASMVYEAEALGALDTATETAGTAIYGTATNGQWSGGTIVHHGTLSTSWTPVLSGRIGGTTYPTHTGSYDIWAVLASTSGTAVQARVVWDVGDLVNPVENPIYSMPGANNRYFARLGEVRIDDPGLGTHRWDWQIQGRGTAGGENLSVDKVWLVNKDEGAWVLRAPTTTVWGLASYISRSEFTTESGAVTGDSLIQGGTWSGAGDADDFSESSDVLTRTATSDSANTGRWIRAGSSTTANVRIRCDVYVPAALKSISTSRFGIFGRYTDTSNWIAAVLRPESSTAGKITVLKRLGGTITTLIDAAVVHFYDAWWTIELVMLGSTWTMNLYPQGSFTPQQTFSSTDSALSSGALSSGGHGIYDEHQSATAGTRQYDNFGVYGFEADAVAYASQSAQLTTGGILREDTGGMAYGPVYEVAGDNPRFPVAPQSSGTVESLLIPTVGDLDQLADTLGTASISARNYRRPSWLFVDNN